MYLSSLYVTVFCHWIIIAVVEYMFHQKVNVSALKIILLQAYASVKPGQNSYMNSQNPKYEIFWFLGKFYFSF